jgi:drug/metabolite transporter (DMT)-like permease
MQADSTTRRTHFLGYSACAIAGCLWGTGFYWGRLALNEMSVEYMVLYRFFFACVGMLPVALLHRVRLNRGEMRMLFVAALLGVPLQFLLQFHGLARTTVSHAALMVGGMPVLLAAAAALFTSERLDWIGWLALCGSTIGAVLVVLGGHRGPAAVEQPTLVGDLLVVASLFMALAWILGPRVLSPWIPNSSAPIPFAHVSATAWIALAISGLACTATTTWLWNWGIHHVPASRAGVFLNVEPVLGSFLGVKLLGEHLGPYAWLGGAMILIAAVVVTTRQHEPEPAVILE